MMGNRTTWMILSRRIPRHVIYQIFKNIIYIRFSALEILRRIERWALKIYHKEERKVFLKKTSLSKCEQYKGEVESLRKINQKIKARTKAPSTKTEINQRILYEGR